MFDIKKIWKSAARKEIFIIIGISFIAGFILRGSDKRESQETNISFVEKLDDHKSEIWTCSMHPQIRQPEPGQCPICGMDLIPVTTVADDGITEREIKLSPAAIKLASIQTAPVKRQFVEKEIRMVGKVEYDESRIKYITSWLPGRIDRLFVDYTGIPVKKGDHVAEIYSPDLYTAQEELIQALKAAEELKNSSLDTARETALRTVESSRKKLRLLGLTDEQIQEFELQGKPVEHVTLYSPLGGIVIHKDAAEGIYVNTGTRIYTIADLSNVWILLDVYESDLEWIRYGQEVEFSTEAYPGDIFKGKIAFIDPILNEKTRTIKVRVNVPNTEEKLKPEMFVKAVVYSGVADGGKVMEPELAGKYICPMHPEIIKNSSGTCDVCGMDIVKAESLGYANPRTDKPPLVIPATAPLITGKRAVVYVSIPGKEGVFAGREVRLGQNTGDYYIVESGLSEDENVVVNGNFKIDSAVQILAKPSMMNPEGGVMPAVHNHGSTEPTHSSEPSIMPSDENMQEHIHGEMDMTQYERDDKSYEISDEFISQLNQVFQAYFHIQNALSHDSLSDAQTGAGNMQNALSGVDMSLVSGDAHMAWMKEYNTIKKSGEQIMNSQDIKDSRNAFLILSQSIINVVTTFGFSGKTDMFRFHCPMADNNNGADWLQNKEDLENPFFGSSMLKCGELVDTITSNRKE